MTPVPSTPPTHAEDDDQYMASPSPVVCLNFLIYYILLICIQRDHGSPMVEDCIHIQSTGSPSGIELNSAGNSPVPSQHIQLDALSSDPIELADDDLPEVCLGYFPYKYKFLQNISAL